ncbi:UNVERIFIED_CONTAM: hypothetical protein FKN15_026481 [Acipenser sinensis]
MDIELNASLATADELSKELGSMWEECSPATDTPEYKSSGYKSSPVGSNEKLNKPAPVSSSRDQPAQASYFSYKPTSHPDHGQSAKSLDSTTAGKYQRTPRPTSLYFPDRQTPPPSGPPRTISSDSLSSYDQRSLPRQLSRSPSPRVMRRNSPFPVYESGQSGLSSPRSLPFERSPSPHLGYPANSSTLPRNFKTCKSQGNNIDDSLGRQRPPNPWNDLDLDVGYKRTPRQQQGLDKYRTLPSNIMPFGNWRESNLDAPPSQAKGLRSILKTPKSESSGRRARLSPLVLLLDASLVGELDVVQSAVQEGLRSILKTPKSESSGRRARLSPLVLLLDASLVGELDVVQSAVQEMSDPSQPNDEGITALHNAICGGHYPVVEFLVQIAANINAADSHGWTPLQCAASCNDRLLCEFLVRNGAAILAVTESDGATAAQKCDPYAPNFEECEQFLRGAEESMGVLNNGVLYALWDYTPCNPDELPFRDGDMVTILQRDDEGCWWWALLCGREGFVPKNYFGVGAA